VEETPVDLFGKHYVPIAAMLQWAVDYGDPVLLVNADITLRLAPWELRRLSFLSEGGLCYFVRHNYTGNLEQATLEQFGMDAFLLHGRDVGELPDSFLCMGQPFWDYWLPYSFAQRGLPVYSAEFPVTFHLAHGRGWSWDTWYRCGLEFGRLTGERGEVETPESYNGMAWCVRQRIESLQVPLPPVPPPIATWVAQRFGHAGPKVFLELGSHLGTDTAWLSELPDVTIHAFEPDPRNEQPSRANVMLHRAAVADRDGRGSLILSLEYAGHPWTYSSSIKRPKNHLRRYPVTFGDAVDVELCTLDTFFRDHQLDVVDFVWADVQGAEREVITGGLHTLSRTRYFYTEYSDDELYEGQPTLAEILELLPDFRVVELWPDDVLLENRRMAA
jgi:2-O-methyltransferase